MPRFAVTSPEGKNYEVTVPDGVTSDDVMQYFQGQSTSQDALTTTQPAQPTLMDNIKSDISGRIAQQKVINAADASGEQNPLRGTLQTVGNIAGGANDIVGRGVGGLASSAYDKLTTQGFKDRQRLGLDSIAASPQGQYVKGVANQYQQNLDTFNKNNPALGRDLSAVREIGAFGMPGSTGSILKAAPETFQVGKMALKVPFQVAGKVGEGAIDIGRDALGIEKPVPIPTPKEMGNVSTQLYKKSADAGAKLPPEFMQDFTQEAKTINPQSDIAKALRGDSAATRINSVLDEFKDKSLDMKEIDEFDKELTRQAQNSWKDGQPTPDTRDIYQIQSKFRKAVDDSAPQQGIEEWKAAKSAFATKKKLEDIQDIFDHAKRMPQEMTAIQTGARNLLENDYRMQGYSPEARKYIEAMATNNGTVDTLKMLGSRLLPIIVGGSGGGIGASAATAIEGAASRNIGASIRYKQGNKAAREVLKGFKPPKDINIGIYTKGLNP